MSTVELPKTADTGTFARYVPFGDGREVIVRRGANLGFHYGLEQSRRMVEISNKSFPLVRYQNLLSPPPLTLGRPPAASASYLRQTDVLHLPDAEIAMPREPDGFTDGELTTILAAIRIA